MNEKKRNQISMFAIFADKAFIQKTNKNISKQNAERKYGFIKNVISEA